MPLSTRARLSLMFFINYVAWGAWYVTIVTYLTTTLHLTGTQAGLVFGTTAVASMISPFFVGLVADRFFSSERVLSALHAIGAVLLLLVARTTSFAGVYALMLAYCLCYFPTIALTNSIAMQQMKNAGQDFPLVRVFGTFGWITIGVIIGHMAIETTSTPFLLSAGASIAQALYSLTLPHTPPSGRGKKITVREILGLDALVMFKRPAFTIFAIASVLACIPLTFYFTFANDYLNDLHVHNAAGKMALGQVSEVVMLALMPLILRKMTVRSILILGMFCWALRYALLAYGNATDAVWMFYIAILLHGICFDFFFITGQLYTDQEAPPNLRSAAQGVITFLTYGVGMFLGATISGGAMDYFTHSAAGVVMRDWRGFWLSTAGCAAAVLLMIALFFRSRSRIEAH
jgi:nucleoside transporter